MREGEERERRDEQSPGSCRGAGEWGEEGSPALIVLEYRTAGVAREGQCSTGHLPSQDGCPSPRPAPPHKTSVSASPVHLQSPNMIIKTWSDLPGLWGLIPPARLSTNRQCSQQCVQGLNAHTLQRPVPQVVMKRWNDRSVCLSPTLDPQPWFLRPCFPVLPIPPALIPVTRPSRHTSGHAS